MFAEFISNLFPQIGNVIQSLSPIVAVVAQALGPVVDMIGQLVSALLPALTNVINFLLPIIQLLASIVASVLGNAFQVVTPILQSVINALTSLCTFISDVFTGNWAGAWEAVKSIFSNCFNALVGIAKVPINGVVSIINGVISGINACGFTIPDWVPGVGGKAFKIDIPPLPMLATGGFTNGVSIAGEKGQEAVISFDPTYRDQNLSYWAKAGQMLGVNDGVLSQLDRSGGGDAGGTTLNVTFAPNITINGSGDNKTDILAVLKKEEEEFMDMIEDMLNRRGGDKYGPSYG